MLASLHPVSRKDNAKRVSKYYPYEDELDMSSIDYPVKVSDIDKFERLNNISVSVFGLDEEEHLVFPLRISQLSGRHHVDLLYINQDEQFHYVLIKSMSRLVGRQLRHHHGHSFICQYCLHSCSTQDTKNKLYFQKTECQLRLLFIIYADFESILEKHERVENDPKRAWTEKHQSHIACGFGMYTVSTDKRFYSKPKIGFGENSAEDFLDSVLCEANRIRNYLKYKVPMERLTSQQWNEFRNTSICHICQKEITENKVRDHDHLTGEYHGNVMGYIYYCKN